MSNKNIFLKEHGIFLERATAKLSSIYRKEERVMEKFDRTRKITKRNGKETIAIIGSCFGIAKTIITYYFNYKDKNFEGSVQNKNSEELKKIWEALAEELQKDIVDKEFPHAIPTLGCMVSSNNEIPKEYFPRVDPSKPKIELIDLKTKLTKAKSIKKKK